MSFYVRSARSVYCPYVMYYGEVTGNIVTLKLLDGFNCYMEYPFVINLDRQLVGVKHQVKRKSIYKFYKVTHQLHGAKQSGKNGVWNTQLLPTGTAHPTHLCICTLQRE